MTRINLIKNKSFISPYSVTFFVIETAFNYWRCTHFESLLATHIKMYCIMFLVSSDWKHSLIQYLYCLNTVNPKWSFSVFFTVCIKDNIPCSRYSTILFPNVKWTGTCWPKPLFWNVILLSTFFSIWYTFTHVQTRTIYSQSEF